MSTLIHKIEQIIKREKTTPEKKQKDDSKKSSSEILSELFGVFNAAPPKIEEITLKKSKKSKKKHKKEKRKRSHSSNSDSDDSDYVHKHKKRKKSKVKKRKHSRSPSPIRGTTPPRIKVEVNKGDVINNDNKLNLKIKSESSVKIEPKKEIEIKSEIKSEFVENGNTDTSPVDASSIPMPESPKQIQLQPDDLRVKLDNKKLEATDCEKSKGKIQIKNLKFSTVFEETVKKAEEEARRKAEKYEEGEYSDSSSSGVKEEIVNSQFPKSSDPGGILKKQAAEESKV